MGRGIAYAGIRPQPFAGYGNIGTQRKEFRAALRQFERALGETRELIHTTSVPMGSSGARISRGRLKDGEFINRILESPELCKRVENLQRMAQRLDAMHGSWVDRATTVNGILASIGVVFGCGGMFAGVMLDTPTLAGIANYLNVTPSHVFWGGVATFAASLVGLGIAVLRNGVGQHESSFFEYTVRKITKATKQDAARLIRGTRQTGSSCCSEDNL